MTSQRRDHVGRHRVLPSWVDRLAGIAVAAAGGTFVNVFSDYTKAKGLAVAAAAAGGLTAASWLRRRPRAPITRYSVRSALALALLAAMSAAFAPANLTALIMIFAGILTTTAVVIQPTLQAATKLLLAAAAVGTSVAALGFGIDALGGGHVTAGATMVIFGIGAAASVRLLIRIDDAIWDEPILEIKARLIGISALLTGVIVTYLGVGLITVGIAILGASCIGIGTAFIIGGSGILQHRESTIAAATIGAGMAVAGGGIGFILSDEMALYGTTGIDLGSAGILSGLSWYLRRPVSMHAWLLKLTREPATVDLTGANETRDVNGRPESNAHESTGTDT